MNLTPPFSKTRKENPGHNLTLGRYTHSVLTLAEIVDTMSDKVCPELLASDDFCDVLTGKMTPLMFPYLFPDLDHAIYVDRYNRSMVLSKEVCALITISNPTMTYVQYMETPLQLHPLLTVLSPSMTERLRVRKVFSFHKS